MLYTTHHAYEAPSSLFSPAALRQTDRQRNARPSPGAHDQESARVPRVVAAFVVLVPPPLQAVSSK